jgi:acetyl-CoA synthetase
MAENCLIDIPPRLDDANISSRELDNKVTRATRDPNKYWADLAKSRLHFFAPFSQVVSGTLTEGNLRWFGGGKLNVCYNCVDRHLEKDHPALLYEGMNLEDHRSLTYKDLHGLVCQIGNCLKELGICKGDTVIIYMPVMPESVAAMLACARIGAIHSVVFSDYSTEALKARLLDCRPRVVLTTMEGNSQKLLWKNVNEALAGLKFVSSVVALRSENKRWDTKPNDKFLWWADVVDKQEKVCACEWMDSEDPLFILYTSGSTGKPKGILHSQAGYLLMVADTFQGYFDYKKGDVHACVADIGWITGNVCCLLFVCYFLFFICC